MSRDRSTGWKYAKNSGHINESNIEFEINNGSDKFSNLCSRMLKIDDLIGSATVGGINETNVQSILGGTTKSKTDMRLEVEGYRPINISIKKSLSGQVYLIKTSRFINGFERHFKTNIPVDVKMGMKLFWGEHEDINNIITKHGEKENDRIKKYEIRKQRLVADSLFAYDKIIYNALIDWFKKNIEDITLYCFSYGLAKHDYDRADYLWYKNLVDDYSYDSIFSIEEVANSTKKEIKTIDFGNRNGGTTIQLPFGFVQWHQGQMQFHHNFDKISQICNSY